MEKKMQKKKMQHSSWWLDHTRPYHSYSLQYTISDLDKKMEKILQVVDNGGDTFAERAEMYYQKRPQLIQMLQNLHSSYRDLATKYDLLLMSPFSSSDSTLSGGGVDESAGGGFPTPSSDILDDDDDDIENDKWKKLKMEVSKLMEDNLCHQRELIKRNDEKRDSIKRLKHENRLLKDSLQRMMMMQQPSPSPSSSSSSSYSKIKKSVFGVFSC